MASVWVVEYRMSSGTEWRPRGYSRESAHAYRNKARADEARDYVAAAYGNTEYHVSEYVRVERKKKARK